MSGAASVIELIVDNKNTVLSGTASRAVQSVVGAHNSTTVVNRRMAAGWSSAQAQGALNLSSRMLDNPTQSYLEFYFYGVMLMATQIGMIMGFSMSMYEDFNGGFFDNGNAEKILAAKSIFYLFMSLGSIVLGMFFLSALFKLPFKGDLFLTMILCLAFLFVVENLSGIAALYFRTKNGLCQCMVFYTLPAFLISGYIWPEIGMFDAVMTPFYALFRYKLAQRLKRSTAD